MNDSSRSYFELEHSIQTIRAYAAQCDKDFVEARDNLATCKVHIGENWKSLSDSIEKIIFLRGSLVHVIGCAEQLMGNNSDEHRFVEIFNIEIGQQIHTANVFLAKLKELSKDLWGSSKQIMHNVGNVCTKYEKTTKQLVAEYRKMKAEAKTIFESVDVACYGSSLNNLGYYVRLDDLPRVMKNFEAMVKIMTDNVADQKEFVRITGVFDEGIEDALQETKALSRAIERANEEIRASKKRSSESVDTEIAAAIVSAADIAERVVGLAERVKAITDDEANRKRVRLDTAKDE